MITSSKKFLPLSTLSLLILANSCVNYVFANGIDNACGNLEIHGEVKLNKNCTYQGPLIITKSNTYLDCNNAILDGKNKTSNGVIIDAQGHGISNVTIKNCNIKNYIFSGIKVSSGIPANKLTNNRSENYKKNASNIKIDSVTINQVSRVGIYLEAYTTDTEITNSIISDSGGVGVYLDQASKNNIISNNIITNNGVSVSGYKREGVAVDSSAGNIIQDNTFNGNGLGGVFLYKNCGEKISSGKSVLRWQHSDNNIIRRNLFVNESVGIWIASRQSYNLRKWDCGDKPMDAKGEYYEDYADNNVVENNKFCDVKMPIRIEGDNNIISKNLFDDNNLKEVEIPTSMREKLTGKKATGNIITGSEKIECKKSN